MFLSANKLLERSIMWLLHNQIKSDISSAVLRFQTIADEISSDLPFVLAQASKESFQRKIDHYCLYQIEHNLATKIATMDPIASAYDIAEIASLSKLDIKTIATIYFEVGNRLSLKWLRSRVVKLPLTNYWQKLASKTLLEDLYFYQRQIAKIVVEININNKNTDIFISNWEKHYQFLIARFDKFIIDIKNENNPDLAMFIVALNRIKPLCI
jgi:glutamate dehydrogenase